MPVESSTNPDLTRQESRAAWRVTLAICLGLIGLVALVYGQTASFEVLNFDDSVYLGDNTPVMDGLTGHGFRWAFVDFGNTSHGGNWHPLTWLSLMLDVEIHGGNAGGFHVINVLLHTVNVLLLFTFLHRTTGAVWPSAMVAALFAVHPLNVESVAWIAERKGMLSTTFFMFALLAYTRYVRLGGLLRYGLVAVLFALGLMAKPVLVTLPFVLLLLDYWPLRRFRIGAEATYDGTVPIESSRPPFSLHVNRFLRLFAEKLPMLAMTVASCTTTFLSERMGGSMTSLESLPMAGRLANSLIAYLAYLEKIFWPVGLAVPYPLEIKDVTTSTALTAGFALLLMSTVTIAVIWRRVQHPWACVGWLWFVGILVPVVKIVHVGREAYSDKFTYLPSIGIFIVVVFGLDALLRDWKYRKHVLGTAGGLVLVTLCALTWVQAGYWKDSITLFTHSLEVTENNYTAHANRALAYQEAGDYDLALKDYDEAVRIKPKFARVYLNRGLVHRRLGSNEQAIKDYSWAIRLYRSAPAGSQGLLGEAYYHRANVFRKIRDPERALVDYGEAIKLLPKPSKAYEKRGGTYQSLRRYDLALADMRKRLDLNRENVQAHNDMAWLLATCDDERYRDGEKAILHATRACELSGWRDAAMLDTLAAAYAESGQFNKAVQWQEKAVGFAPDDAKASLRSNLKLYQSGRPYRQMPPKD